MRSGAYATPGEEGAYLKEVLGSCVFSWASECSSGLRVGFFEAPGHGIPQKPVFSGKARDWQFVSFLLPFLDAHCPSPGRSAEPPAGHAHSSARRGPWFYVGVSRFDPQE